MKEKVFILLLVATFSVTTLSAQRVALKTNVAYDLTGTIHLGAEYRLAPQWTAELTGNYNNWTLSHARRWKHWLVQPELRYWWCESWGGHFAGFHLQGGKYNVGNLKNGIQLLGTDFSELSNKRYQGWLLGGGVAYGYAWILGKHWNLEGEIGVGYNFTKSDCYPCATCGKKIRSGVVHHYWGLTKLAVNVVYIW